MAIKHISIVAPFGMQALAVEPWCPGEVYAVAAHWSQATSPVYVYGYGGWDLDSAGRRVADFRGAKDALAEVIREVIVDCGDEPDDDKVAAIVARAEYL